MTDQKTQEWRKPEKWTRRGKGFAVEVYHYTEPGPETFDDGRNRRTGCFDVMEWRGRHPGCTIFINGALCDYGAWAD